MFCILRLYYVYDGNQLCLNTDCTRTAKSFKLYKICHSECHASKDLSKKEQSPGNDSYTCHSLLQ